MKRILEIPAAIFRGIANIFKAIFNGIVWFFTTIIRGIQAFFAFLKRQILTFIAALKNPFGTSVSSTKGLIYAIVVGVLVAVLMLIFQPFGTAEFTHTSKTLYLLGFGVVAFLGMLIGKFLLPMLLKNFYDEHHWTVGKQIIQIVLIALIISTLCIFYANTFGIGKFDFVSISGIVFVAALIGGTILTFVQEIMQRSKFETSAANISRKLDHLQLPASKQTIPVLLFGEGSNKLSLLPNQLIYAETSPTSTDFHYQNIMGVEKKTVNVSPEKVKKELANHPQFVHCGSNHIVNLKALKKVAGSARGYHLTIARLNHELSVSRKHLGSFEKAVN